MMYMWVGLAVAAEWIQQVFGVASAAHIDVDKVCTLVLSRATW